MQRHHMDQLETQVSDLRSFLGAAPVPQSGPEHDVVDFPSAAPLRVSTHGTHHSTHSTHGAHGDNSALAQHHSSVYHHAHRPPSSPGTVSASSSSHNNILHNNNNNAKRRADEPEPDEGPASKQQRSKRNRVRWRFYSVFICSLLRRVTSSLCGLVCDRVCWLTFPLSRLSRPVSTFPLHGESAHVHILHTLTACATGARMLRHACSSSVCLRIDSDPFCPDTGCSNECKRRKIKCNGQTPCQRCGHLNLQCLYAPNCCANFKDSDEFRLMADQVRELQDQVGSLVSSVNTLRQETARLAPLQDRVLPVPSVGAGTPSSSSLTLSGRPQRSPLPFRVPSFFNGPTSIAFTVDVAKNTLHNMGYSGVGDGNEDAGGPQDATPHASPLLAPLPPPDSLAPQSQAAAPTDPIWEFDEAEMMRLLDVYREEVDVMYPVASVGPVADHIKYVGAWMDTARRSGVVPHPGLEQVIADPRTRMLKIFMCCALVVAEHGNSAKAERLYGSIQPTVDKMLMSDPADVTKLSFLALCAGYRYLSNDEVLAWRMMGQVARLCLELGLHRREGLLKIADPQTRRDALHTFWSAYVLDRRWSFSTGLPFVCHDDKIDPKLPYPVGVVTKRYWFMKHSVLTCVRMAIRSLWP